MAVQRLRGNRDVGIAAECGEHTGVHLFEDLVITEVVDADNQPVPLDEYGAKVLVTALFSRTALALMTVALLVTARSVTRGSGQLATESIPVSGFTKVELSGTGDSGDTLSVGTKPITTIVTTKPITYSVTVKDLTGLALSG